MLATDTAIKIASRFTSKDETRLQLCCVSVEKTRVLATDGHRAIILPILPADDSQVGLYLEGALTSEPLKFPDVDYVTPKERPRIALDLSVKHVARLRSLLFLMDRRTNLIIRFTPDEDSKGVASLHMARETAKQSAGESVTVTEMPLPRVHEVALNPRYLIEAIDAVYGAIETDVSLYQDGPQSKDSYSTSPGPIVIEGPMGKALVMPCR